LRGSPPLACLLDHCGSESLSQVRKKIVIPRELCPSGRATLSPQQFNL
jgi:hypothetical protein